MNKIIFLFLLWGCSSQPELNNQLYKAKGHRFLYSHPEFKESKLDNNIKRIVIVGTNDFHGSLDTSFERTSEGEGVESVKVPSGGAEYFSSYLKILRQKYPSEVLLLDAGDIYQGSLLSNLFKGESVVQYYNYLQYDALALGNHEFDFGPKILGRVIPFINEDPQGAIKLNAKNSKAPFVTSNIIDLKTGKNIDWENTKTTLIKQINGVKVGIIGGTTLDTPNATVRNNVRGLYFEDQALSILKQAKTLRKNGAQIIVFNTHTGTKCGDKFASLHNVPVEKVNFDPHQTDLCDQDGELFKVLKKIPKGIIDAVVAGHTHSKIANFIEGIPVIQSYSYGRYFGRIEIFYDTNEKKVLTEKTIIHQPTRICHYFFKESEDCYPGDSDVNHREQTSAKFLGEEIKPDIEVIKLLQKYKDEVDKNANSIITNLLAPLKHIRHDEESPFGSFVADAMRDASSADIAITNAGGIRTSLDSGKLTFGELYKALPFDNYLVTVEVSGQELLELIRIGTSGMDRGQGLFSGLIIEVSRSKDSQISNELIADNKKEDWERDRLTSVRLENGKAIELNNTYKIVTNSFMATAGGDRYGFVFDRIPKEKKQIDYANTYRDAVINRFKKMGSINAHINSDDLPYLKTRKSKIIYRP